MLFDIASAQTKPPAPAKPAPSATQQTPAANTSQRPAWNALCTSPSRQGELECAMEQTAVFTQTGQLVAKISLRVPPATRAPVMMIQVPVGLYLPGGISLQVDDKKPEQLAVQTCDLNGCYAGSQISKDLLAAMESGTRLAIIFQNTAQEKITVPLSIGNFSEAFNRIK
jgi:invasion protein IalB